MKISDFGAIQSSNSTQKKRSSGQAAGAFADMLAAASGDEASETNQVSDAAATMALSNLLMLQEISEEDIHRKKLAQQGKNMLDALEQLRRQLLLGTLPVQVLQDLHRQLALQKQTVNDPKLMSIIEDIELRAAVELAKLNRAVADYENQLQSPTSKE